MSKFKSILIAFMCVIACFAFASCNWDVPSDGSTGDKTSVSETTSDKESDSVKESTSEKVSTCEHEFVLQSEEAPDCTHAGKKTFKCGKCGEVKTEEGEAALGHLFGEWEVVNAETCTVDGEEARYCTREKCNGMETRAIPAAHKYAENTAESVAPTCEKVGKDVYECSVCHDKYDEVVPALGHEENTDIERIVVEATCEKGGYTTLTCARCGKTYNIDETEALGHNYEAGESVEATCDFAGYTAMKCSRCDKNYRKITAAKLSHTIGDDGVCETCGKTYLDANALIVSSEDNQAYAVKDDVYDYLVYAKDDTSYQTTITIDRQIVDKLIANRYFKINFKFGNPDNCYRAMGYKLPGDENFRYVNVFQTEGLGDNTLFTLVIADENGADETVVTETGITLTLLYRYNGKDGVTSDKEPEEKYHGTLNNFALKIEYVLAPRPFTPDDYTTYFDTSAKMTAKDSSVVVTAAAGTQLTIRPEAVAYWLDNGFDSINLEFTCKEGQATTFDVVVDGTKPVPPAHKQLTITAYKLTEAMRTKGIALQPYYANFVDGQPHDESDGYVMAISTNKPFNPETDEVISTATDYVYAEGIYTLTGKDPRVTVLAKAIAYWLDNGYTSIDIIVSDKEGQRAGKNVQINGADHGANDPTTTVNVTLTEEMRASGLSLILYWSDISGWAGGSAPDGVTLQIVAKK